MSRFLGVLSVILFWVLAVVLIPIAICLGAATILFYMAWMISSMVYEASTNYFRKKNL